MKCSPHYKDELGNIKNEERLDVQGMCNENCVHYEACKKELGLKEDYVFPEWVEEEVGVNEILEGRTHRNKNTLKNVVWINKSNKKNMEIPEVKPPEPWGKSEVHPGMSIAESIMESVVEDPINEAGKKIKDEFISAGYMARHDPDGYDKMMGKITKEEFDNHDCHLSSEDGCKTCEQWFNQNN